MVSEQELEEFKLTVQKIIDKYLPDGKEFSVKDFNQEQLWYICRLLMEKDDVKRKKIRKEIVDKTDQAKYEYKEQYYEIVKNKELFDSYTGSVGNIDDLANDIEAERDMDNDLNNI